MSQRIKIQEAGEARTTNPSAKLDGQEVRASFDDLGRQLITVHQVRDLISTARASITTAGESSLLAGVASTFHDLLQISGANESTNAVSVVIRDATGGGAVLNLEIPANNTKDISFPVPVPQNVLADTWTVQVTDFVNDGTTSNGTVVVTALFAKNI